MAKYPETMQRETAAGSPSAVSSRSNLNRARNFPCNNHARLRFTYIFYARITDDMQTRQLGADCQRALKHAVVQLVAPRPGGPFLLGLVDERAVDVEVREQVALCHSERLQDILLM